MSQQRNMNLNKIFELLFASGDEHSQKQRGPYKKIYREGICLPLHFPLVRNRIEHLEIRPDDVWVCSVPRSGTQWFQEAVWRIANNVNLKEGPPLNERFPFLEWDAFWTRWRPDPRDPAKTVSSIERCSSPRFIKTYLPFELLPRELKYTKDAKIVYVSRNPRDVCISSYYHQKKRDATVKDLEQYSQLFMEGKLLFLPYWNHVLPFWRRRHEPNILFITYEEMKKRPTRVISKIAAFLGKKLTRKAVKRLVKDMKSSGVLTSEPDLEWRNEMCVPLVDRFEKWEQGELEGTNYQFVYKSRFSNLPYLQNQKFSSSDIFIPDQTIV